MMYSINNSQNINKDKISLWKTLLLFLQGFILILGFLFMSLNLLDYFVVFHFGVTALLSMMLIAIFDPRWLFLCTKLLWLTTFFRLFLSVIAAKFIIAHFNAGHIIFSYGDFIYSNMDFFNCAIILMIVFQFFLILKITKFNLQRITGFISQSNIHNDNQKTNALLKEVKANLSFIKIESIVHFVLFLLSLIGVVTLGRYYNFGNLDALYTGLILSVGYVLTIQIPALMLTTATGIALSRFSYEKLSQIRMNIADRTLNLLSYYSAAISFFNLFLTLIVMGVVQTFTYKPDYFKNKGAIHWIVTGLIVFSSFMLFIGILPVPTYVHALASLAGIMASTLLITTSKQEP